MIASVRAARPAIVLNGKDFYSSLAPYFLTMEYTDNCDGEKADDLTIELADRDKRFISDWMPAKGAFMDVSIVAERWFALNAPTLTLDCGRLWIDEITFQLPANTVSIKASSLPTTAHIKGSDETRGWEGSSLKDIATQIAGENGMTINYQSSVNPQIARTEQNEESGLAFLKKLTKDASLSIKLHRNQIVIFDEAAYEAAADKFAIIYGDGPPSTGLPTYRVASGHFATKLTDVLKKVKVRHTKLETGDVSQGEFDVGGDDPNLPESSEQTVTESPEYPPDDSGGGGGSLRDDSGGLQDYALDSPSEASERKAKSTARDKNKHKNTGSIQLAIGNPLIAAGMNFNLSGLGAYDGKWFVVSAQHKVGPQYDTTLEVRKCLTGY